MSATYLELTTRIPVVAAQTEIGSARLQEAQEATGLSNESIARQIPVSTKTWERWKKMGRVPTASLPAVAKALNLTIVRPVLDPLEVEVLGDGMGAVLERLTQVEDATQEILKLLQILVPPTQPQ